ncbi:MAG TPA: hypothetical protein VGM87_23900, partial [Roseomonas sp.]
MHEHLHARSLTRGRPEFDWQASPSSSVLSRIRSLPEIAGLGSTGRAPGGMLPAAGLDRGRAGR